MKEPKFALEFRIWICSIKGNSDSYYRYNTFEEAKQNFKKLKSFGIPIQTLCAVVWDNKFKRFREVVINDKTKKMR